MQPSLDEFFAFLPEGGRVLSHRARRKLRADEENPKQGFHNKNYDTRNPDSLEEISSLVRWMLRRIVELARGKDDGWQSAFPSRSDRQEYLAGLSGW
jgi:hypothetical protein